MQTILLIKSDENIVQSSQHITKFLVINCIKLGTMKKSSNWKLIPKWTETLQQMYLVVSSHAFIFF